MPEPEQFEVIAKNFVMVPLHGFFQKHLIRQRVQLVCKHNISVLPTSRCLREALTISFANLKLYEMLRKYLCVILGTTTYGSFLEIFWLLHNCRARWSTCLLYIRTWLWLFITIVTWLRWKASQNARKSIVRTFLKAAEWMNTAIENPLLSCFVSWILC